MIKEFDSFICEMRRGNKPNYEFILEEISFIDLIENDKIDNKLSLIIL